MVHSRGFIGGGGHTQGMQPGSQAGSQARRPGSSQAARQHTPAARQPGSQAIRQLTASSAYMISLISILGALAWIIELMNFLRNFNC